MIEEFKKTCEKSIKKFEEQVLPLNYTESGIFIWEGFAVCAMADFFNIDVLIESGTAGGMSAEIFCKYFKIPIFTIENISTYGKGLFEEVKKKLSIYENITCMQRDSTLAIQKLIEEELHNLKIGLFFDGPKGKIATDLAKKCFENSFVKFVGVHDECHKNRYHEMDEWDKTVFYTDAEWFVKKYSYLDNQNKDNLCFQACISECPNGYGIGFAVNK